MLNRRRLLTMGGVVGGGLLLGGGVGGALLSNRGTNLPAPTHHASALDAHNGVQELLNAAPPVEPFTIRMPLPRVLQPMTSTSLMDVYQLSVRQANVEILPGLQTPAITYGGQFIGPTIRARVGRPVLLRLVNQLGEPANIHLHGGHVPAASDGHPLDVVDPGGTRLYDYPNRQDAATLWYHDHAHHMEAEHVYRGMHGFYLLEDDDERYLRLPSGLYDVPIMIRNAAFDETGALLFNVRDSPAARATTLVNGKPTPYFPVAARKYRFRILNGANHWNMKINLGGRTMLQIAGDGGLLPAPVPTTELPITAAERAEIVIDFSQYPVGTQLVLSHESGPIMRFDVVRTATDDSRVPSVLRPLPAMPPATVVRDMTLGLSDDFSVFWIDGKPFDPNRVDLRIRRGTTEIWRITNLDTRFNIAHSFHMHLTQFQVLDRDGGAPLPNETGLKDTVLIPAGSTVSVKATFGTHLGRYVYHCHMMEHSAAFAMMGQMEIVS
jgi:spore coat protein A, manganese oxidase